MFLHKSYEWAQWQNEWKCFSNLNNELYDMSNMLIGWSNFMSRKQTENKKHFYVLPKPSFVMEYVNLNHNIDILYVTI